ncbi:hypothetical protein N9U75_00925 [Pelagibacteraceae bacterium]|nr:hypothetical protein [Pelagibacteraceae bacterium]
MCLKKNKLIFILIFITFFLQKNLMADENSINKVINYLDNLHLFSASFIQNDGETLSEGLISIGMKRIRVEYLTPSKILIILDDNKAMYYNYELQEDEFFDPSDTNAWFFYDIFNNPNFFFNSKLISTNNELILSKKGENKDGQYKINIFFEEKPLVIRKIELFLENSKITLSLYNHLYEAQFDKNYFKLINPKFFDE